MMEPTAHMPAPDLALADATPVSQAFGDVYFSRDGGVAETTHVFLAGNGLPQRWQDHMIEGGLAPYPRHEDGVTPAASGSPWKATHAIAEAEHRLVHRRFTIGELGFGSGLNFLVAWKAFCDSAPADATLHYIAIEGYPFTHDQLRDVLALQPELAAQAEQLIAHYPLRLPGLHRIHLPRVVLTLCFGDVSEMLAEITAPVDAWFLDGFSPAKNPDMWNESIYRQVARLSAPRATFATFTAASHVRRGLATAGFTVEKTQGFGHKREMTVGILERGIAPAVPKGVGGKPPFNHILVIGAGIAGASVARAVAERGLQVTVLERAGAASGASGNTAGVLFPQLTKRWTHAAAWYFTAYGFALRQLQHWHGQRFDHARIGMLRLPRHDEEAQQLQTLHESLGLDPAIVHWLPRDEASAQAGVALQTGGAFFPHGTWVSPVQWCSALLQHPAITVRPYRAVTALARDGAGWAVTLTDGEVLTADGCVVAAAHDSAALLAEYGVRLQAVGGQVSEIAAQDVSTPLRTILCHKGYIIPCGDRYLVGATYHREDMTTVTDAHHATNLAELAAILPDWFRGNALAGRSAIRATTPDRLPYVGALAEGLYVSTGHGSRGLLSAPLAAEIIASDLMAEAAPVSAQLAAAVNPRRFMKA
jgi:tRNA 5-methylaminomethyl-2-thiouridine biosynthesis bifunctional protein